LPPVGARCGVGVAECGVGFGEQVMFGRAHDD
jgi:hypothetical protein